MNPQKLGPYRIVRKLGEGGMGAVYEGVDDRNGQRAAVKVLPAGLATREGFRLRFDAEIETLRKLENPSIVKLFGFGDEAGQLFYSMEYVEGRSLQDFLDDGKRFTWREVIDIGLQLCKALKHAHDRGIIHRDIKPANIMLTPDGVAKLADFGIARLYGMSGMTMNGGPIGTANYMAPEQTDGSTVTERSDIYALGGTFYALLAGRPPFVATSLMQMLQMQKFTDPEPVGAHAPGVPRELEIVIANMLKKAHSDRLPNATMLGRSLQAVLDAVNLRETQSPAAPAASPAASAVQTRRPAPPRVPPDATEIAGTRDRAAAQMPADDQTLASPLPADDATLAGGGGRISDSTAPIPPGKQGDTTAVVDDSDITIDSSAAADETLASSAVARAAEQDRVRADDDTYDLALDSAPGSPSASRAHGARDADVVHVDEEEGDDSSQSVFVTAEEAAEEDRRRVEEAERARPTVIPYRAIFTVLFIVLGVPLTIYLLRPPSADETYSRIIAMKADAEGGNNAMVERIQLGVIDFKNRFPDDPRREELQDLSDSFDQLRIKQPVIRLYDEAMSEKRTNPELTLQRLEALLALYGDPMIELDKREQIRLDKAKEEVVKLRELVRQIGEKEGQFLQGRLDRARQMKDNNPAYARTICESIIAVYGGKRWADGHVVDARRLLEELPAAGAAVPD